MGKVHFVLFWGAETSPEIQHGSLQNHAFQIGLEPTFRLGKETFFQKKTMLEISGAVKWKGWEEL